MSMRAAIIPEAGGPDVITIEERSVPEPATGEALVRVAYAALNPLDTHARANRIAWMHPGFPFTPGFEYAGRVEAVGPGVDTGLLGQRVACNGQWGGNADYAIAEADKLIPVPEGFDWPTAAAFSTCAYTAWLLIHSAARVQPGQVVAIHSAAGAVGALTTQVAKAAGATVIALAGGADKLRYASQFGADFAVSYLEEDWPEQVKAHTDGRGADVIIDGNAGDNALKNFDAIASLGNVIFMGATAGLAADVNISMLIGKCCSVTGFVQYVHQATSGGAEVAAMHGALADGSFKLPIERTYGLEQLGEAHEAWEHRALVGRTLIEAGGEL
ncbi:MAG: zinc-binding dehydrogenase [Pseudomonadota bacterium]